MGKWSDRKTVSNTVSVSIRQNIATNYKLSNLNTIGARNWIEREKLDINKFNDFYSFLLVSKRTGKYVIDYLKQNSLNTKPEFPALGNDFYLMPSGEYHKAHMYLFNKKDHPIWEDFVETDIGPTDNLIENYLKLGKEITKVHPTNRKIKRPK